MPSRPTRAHAGLGSIPQGADSIYKKGRDARREF